MTSLEGRKSEFCDISAVLLGLIHGQYWSNGSPGPGRNGIFSAGQPAQGTGYRLVVHAAYLLHGDERREGLCAAAVSLATLSVVPGFAEAAGVMEWVELAALESRLVLGAASACLSACADRARTAAEAFGEGMRRRCERDRERLEAYFADLLGELERRARRAKNGAAEVTEKRRIIERERVAKLEALAARYSLKVELKPVALVLIESPTHRIPIELRRRKASRAVELEYDWATRSLVAPICDGCGSAAPRPAACDDAMHLLCEECAPKSEGRIRCLRCHAVASKTASRISASP